MADDPTTKPCPVTWSLGHAPDCPTCHGTGRVPMDTGGLLEALRDIDGGVEIWSEGGIWHVWAVSTCYRGDEYIAEDVDDALRAALRGVTG